MILKVADKINSDSGPFGKKRREFIFNAELQL